MDCCFAQVSSGDSLKHVVEAIANNNKYESMQVGFAGSLSDQFKNYQRLLRFATDKDLLLLIRHKNPAVRVYAFKALLRINRKLSSSTYHMIKADTTMIFTLNGCIGGQSTVAGLAYTLIAGSGLIE